MKDQRVYLAHILECIERIGHYTTEGKEAFLIDIKTQDAVIRNLEVIGEASRRIDERFQNSNPEIPWRGMIGLRNVLAHHYVKVDIAEVWQVVEKDLPDLEKALKVFLPPLEQLESEIAGEESQSTE
jgi:uncharacterized protein with HEPN domain